MALLGSRNICTLVLEDRGTFLWDGAGNTLASIAPMAPGPERRSAWTEALRETCQPRQEVQILFAHGEVSVDCHEAPYLPPRERRDAALSLLIAENPSNTRHAIGVTLDADPAVKAGHVLWTASYPPPDMFDAISAIEAAGARIVYAAPVQRLLLRGLDQAGVAPGDRLLLALDSAQGRIAFYRGRTLVLLRTFRIPGNEDADARDEILFEEISRTLQYIKQRQRTSPPEILHAVGIGHLGPAFAERLQRTQRLSLKELAPAAATFILAGARLERSESGGMNLVPQHILETRKRRMFRLLTWGAAAALVALCLAAGVVVRLQESQLAQEADRAEANLEARRRILQESDQVARARMPLLRLRLAEELQSSRTRSLDRLSAILFAAPQGVTLDTIEIREHGGATGQFDFQVTGTALSQGSLSVAPLAQYLDAIQELPGVSLAPLQTVDVTDLRAVGAPDTQAPTHRAAARFTLQGTAP